MAMLNNQMVRCFSILENHRNQWLALSHVHDCTCIGPTSTGICTGESNWDGSCLSHFYRDLKGSHLYLPDFLYKCGRPTPQRLWDMARYGDWSKPLLLCGMDIGNFQLFFRLFNRRFHGFWPGKFRSRRDTEVREGLLLFTIFFNCSQTCAGVAELAIPASGASWCDDLSRHSFLSVDGTWWNTSYLYMEQELYTCSCWMLLGRPEKSCSRREPGASEVGTLGGFCDFLSKTFIQTLAA